VPDRFPDWPQEHFRHNRLKEIRQPRLALQQLIGASKGFDEPLNAVQFGNLSSNTNVCKLAYIAVARGGDRGRPAPARTLQVTIRSISSVTRLS